MEKPIIKKDKMKKNIFLLFVLFLLGCKTTNSILAGRYVSDCRLYNLPEYVIQIREDSTYIRTHPYMKGIVWSGIWIQKLDTITMIDQYEIRDNVKVHIDTIDFPIHWNHTYLYIRKGKNLIEISNKKHSYKIKRRGGGWSPR